MDLLDSWKCGPTLVLLVGVQSHQFQRALDLATYAKNHGSIAVIGGPHPMTCDISMLQGHSGISFAQAEAESILETILDDAVRGYELQPVYGENQRWAEELSPPVLIPPDRQTFRRYVIPTLGVYPARGCPFTCNFCSVIKIAGRRVRGQPIDTTIATLKAAQAAGIKLIAFTSDNFNKIPDVRELLTSMIEEKACTYFFCQCDTQIASEPELVELMARAGCIEIFVGAESFNRKTLLAAHKAQNHPEKYVEIVRLCQERGISAHFSNIIGFPEDTEEGILEHLRILKELDPAMASFYILCPIPGTEQYDDFMARGIVSEMNLDRFDGTQAVWDHPHLSKADRARLLMHCYRKFYTLKHTAKKLRWVRNKAHASLLTAVVASTSYAAFFRWCTHNNKHPMSGGVGEVKLDHVSEYIGARERTYGYHFVPLPKSLRLSAADERLNRLNLKLTAV